ncbi:MAG TPA: DUF2325 domain-containing protein [Xanthobacteraceae bacterium]|nr:DUF2325 domain-containing protein [Xanthobacteraceae bacterium]
MSARGAQLLTRVFDPGEPKPSLTPATGRASMASAVTPPRDTAAKLAPASKRRTQIWELHQSLHCSIIGTCLSSGEMRRLLVRLKVEGAETADDHDLHVLGVLLAGRSKAGAKQLQKTLDRRHQTFLNQFAKAKDAAALSALWEDALARGDIPGAYWALLTHPAATDTMVKDVFGKIHMLSHLVGAANRADIRRLRQLEEHNADLTAKLERQQRQLRDGFVSRDETIRRLNGMLARAASQEAIVPSLDAAEDSRAVKDALAELDKRLAHETGRRERLELRLASVSEALNAAERTRSRAEGELETLHQELALLEARLGATLQTVDAPDGLDLNGLTVLYVGGRANQTPQLKGLIESTGGRFLYHDGGIEHSATLLPGLVSRADIAVFPVDCVSHDAVGAVKRVCGQLGKRYLPLRTSSLTCLFAGLSGMQPAPASVASA